MRADAARQIDLLAWQALRDAERLAAEADAAWRTAQRRYRCAPHGMREQRLRALQEASSAAISAGLDLDRLRRSLS
jgi:hypothetical protein